MKIGYFGRGGRAGKSCELESRTVVEAIFGLISRWARIVNFNAAKIGCLLPPSTKNVRLLARNFMGESGLREERRA